jgi:integral membrane protein
MPVKYMMDNPILVKYIGMGHGVLFVLFLVVLFAVCEKQKWSLSMFIWVDRFDSAVWTIYL